MFGVKKTLAGCPTMTFLKAAFVVAKELQQPGLRIPRRWPSPEFSLYNKRRCEHEPYDFHQTSLTILRLWNIHSKSWRIRTFFCFLNIWVFSAPLLKLVTSHPRPWVAWGWGKITPDILGIRGLNQNEANMDDDDDDIHIDIVIDHPHGCTQEGSPCQNQKHLFQLQTWINGVTSPKLVTWFESWLDCPKLLNAIPHPTFPQDYDPWSRSPWYPVNYSHNRAKR